MFDKEKQGKIISDGQLEKACGSSTEAEGKA